MNIRRISQVKDVHIYPCKSTMVIVLSIAFKILYYVWYDSSSVLESCLLIGFCVFISIVQGLISIVNHMTTNCHNHCKHCSVFIIFLYQSFVHVLVFQYIIFIIKLADDYTIEIDKNICSLPKLNLLQCLYGIGTREQT